MKKFLFCIFFILANSLLYPQPLLVENFDYTIDSKLTDNGWTAHSGPGSNPISVKAGLTYSGYVNSGIGGSAYLANSGEDVYKEFGSLSSGSIYYSALVKVESIASGYFLHLAKDNTSFAARVFITTEGGGFKFGLSNTSTANYSSTPTIISTGSTVLVIVKYTFFNAEAKLWVFSSGVPGDETSQSPEVTFTGNGQSSISRICLRQFDANQKIFVDGIRVATSWDNAPLPVELTSFTAKYLSSGVVLNWQTATEINNNKFEVERKINEGEWEVVGTVLGHGNSNTVIDYTYTDTKTSTKGKYNYRLKQIDNDGSFKYSQVIEVTVGNLDNYELAQNYPNPFNPVTNINFTMPKSGNVKILLYNTLGQEVATIFNGNKEAGFHTVQFNANGLPSGIYFYQMTSEGFNQVKKMILTK